MQIIKATYDGRDFHPDEPLALPPDTRVTLTVHVEEPGAAVDVDSALYVPPATDSESSRKPSFADAVRRIRICGPPDWSERVDYYMGHDMSRYSDNPDLRQDDLKNEHG